MWSLFDEDDEPRIIPLFLFIIICVVVITSILLGIGYFISYILEV